MASIIYKLCESGVVFGFTHNGVYCFFNIDGQQYDVRAGTNGTDSPLAILVGVGDGLHVDSVGKHKSVECHLLSKQRLHNAFRQRRWHIRPAVESIDLQVSYHHAAYSIVDQMTKREEVDTVDIILTVLDERQIHVAIHISVAVTRKMFSHSDDASALHGSGI